MVVTRKLPPPGGVGDFVEAEVVDIKEMDEKPILIKLADGTELRIRLDIVEICRAKDMWDNAGRPVYHINNSLIISIIDTPIHLLRK